MNRRQFLLGVGAALTFPQLTTTGPRFAVISDIQMRQDLSAGLFPLLAQRPVEFVIIAGDVVGLGTPFHSDPAEQWQTTLADIATIGKPWLAVPGNHDLDTAYNRPDSSPVQPDAAAAWAQFAGPRRWVKDLEYTRIIGLDYSDWSQATRDWITVQLATGKRKMVISHYPLTGCGDKWKGLWDWWDWWEAEKLAFFEAYGVDVFVCGHRHQFGLARVGRMMHVICPPVARVVGEGLPEIAPNGLLPTTIPMRGWLEFVDGDPLTCEVYREDGQRVMGFVANEQQEWYFPFVARQQKRPGGGPGLDVSLIWPAGVGS